MKTQIIYRIAFLFIMLTTWMNVKGQQQWEVPGDNFSLEGALEIFKESTSPEEFEKMLNHPDAKVNNLDLNGDGYIDYIRVIDMYEGNVHAFVLQAVISKRESQDIAVITLEKLANGKAILQITGDADIYGVETIIEPTSEVRTYAGTNRSRVIVNVWAWPMVRYVYGPYYSVWVSPWGWSYRPYWWSPWRPVYYVHFHSYWRPFRPYYSVCYTHRIVYAHEIYSVHRTTSVIVHKTYNNTIREYRSRYIARDGNYQQREGRYASRQPGNVRYDSNGRLISNAGTQVRSRSAARSADQDRSARIGQSETSVRRAEGTRERSTGSYNYSRNSTGSTGEPHLRRSDAGSDRQSSSGRSAGQPQMRRSDGNSGIQRSDVRTNSGAQYRRAESHTNVQRSTRSSSGNSGFQRSKVTSSDGAQYRRSDSPSSIQRSSGKSQGSHSIQRSPQRTGSAPNFRAPSGNSNSGRSHSMSSGNSGSRNSHGTTNARVSSGSRSGTQGSSGRTSGSSNSKNSGRSSRH